MIRDAHRRQQDDMRDIHRQQQEELQRAAAQIQQQQQHLDNATQRQEAQATLLDQLGALLATRFTAMQDTLAKQLSEQQSTADRPRKSRASTVLPEQGVYATQAGLPKAPSPPASLLSATVPPPPSRPASSASTESWVMASEMNQHASIQDVPQSHGLPQTHVLSTPPVSGDEGQADEDDLDSDSDLLLGAPQFTQ